MGRSMPGLWYEDDITGAKMRGQSGIGRAGEKTEVAVHDPGRAVSTGSVGFP